MTVTASSFSFTHPAMLANSAATVSIRDANTTTVIATSAPFSVSAAGTTVPGPPTSVAVASTASTTAVVTFSPPTTGGAIDHGGYQVAYKLASEPTYTNGPFVSVITPGSGSFTDLQSNVHTVTSGGQIAVNGVVDGTTSGVIIDMLNGQVESQENTALNWYSRTLPGTAWGGAQAQAPLSLSGVVVTGLVAATAYDFKVSAANSAGTGAFSSVVTATTPSSASSGSFTMSGNTILDPSGNPWVSKGVAIWGAGDAIGGSCMTSSFNIVAKLFGTACNTIRFTCFDANGDITPTSGPCWPTNIAGLVNFATNNGAGPTVLILSYTQTGAVPGTSPSTNFAQWLTACATTFKNNPYVWYEILNEPNPTDGSGNPVSDTYVYGASLVRGAGATAPIIVQPAGGVQGMAAGSLNSLTNWCWSRHFYAWESGNSTNVQTNINVCLGINGATSAGGITVSALQSLYAVPVILGETGSGGANGESVLDVGAGATMAAAESCVNSGACVGLWVWELHAAGGVSDSMTPNGGTLSTSAALNGYGNGVLTWMQTGTVSQDVSNT